MSVDLSRIDLLIQYSLLIAGEEDSSYDRQLGPIHLIKYVYLGDLAFARRNQGETFTAVPWQFFNFGPWSQTVHQRIEPALGIIGASKQQFESDFEERKDWVRWSLCDSHLLEEKRKVIPASIQIQLDPLIRKFKRDTPALLDYVYSTQPLLNAAPNEYLDFSVVAKPASEPKGESESLRMESLSKRKQTAFGERMRLLQRHLEAKPPRNAALINPVKNPRYDEVYDEGLNWLDSLAGEKLATGEKVAEFSDEVWKSSTRKGGDVS